MFKTSRFTAVILAAVFAISLSNCAVRVGTTHNTAKAKPLPPGHNK